MCKGVLRPNSPNEDIKPISPKQWSPCRCDMKMWSIKEKCTCDFLNCNCVPSPQSIINCLFPMRTICVLALCRVVGSAEPHPNMCTSNGSILFMLAVI